MQLSPSCQIKDLIEIYEKYLPDNGVFLEAGAYDGITHSNTSCLAEIGWTGIYIEPVPKYYQKCYNRYINYPHIKCINVGLSDREGYEIINIQGEFSTINEEDNQVLRKIPYFEVPKRKQAKIWCTTLDGIFKDFNINQLDLLVLDVEGLEGDILKNCSIKPYMAIIELHELSEEWLKHSRTLENIDKVYSFFSDYEVVYKDDINTIFVKDNGTKR